MNEQDRSLLKKRAEAETKLIENAWENPEFREALIADPRATLEKAFDVVFPDDVEVEVLEETPHKVYLVLPQRPTQDLEDADLERVAGGVRIGDVTRVRGIRDFLAVKSLGGPLKFP